MSNDKKLVLLAGILAAGIFAAAFASTQLLSASAQSTNNTVTSADDIDCSKDVSSVHCVDGPIVTSENSTKSVTSADDVNCEEDVSAVHCVDGNTTVATSHDFVSRSTVSTSGTATTRVDPDKFSVTVGVETNGTTAQEAADRNADAMEEVIAALRALGISEDAISTSNYSVYPVYEYRQSTEPCIMIYPPPPECQPKNEITGYRATNSVTVTLDADGQIDAGQVLDTAIESGANTVQGAYFFLSQERQMEVQDGLIREAINNARQRADIAADAVGLEVSGVKSINLNDVFFPIISRGAEVLAADTQILPGQQDVTLSVMVEYYMGEAGAAGQQGEDTSGAENAVAIARQFILSKLSGLGIEIDDEFDLHTDMVVELTESEFSIDFGVIDTENQAHEGHIELENGEVTVAVLDGESIL